MHATVQNVGVCVTCVQERKRDVEPGYCCAAEIGLPGRAGRREAAIRWESQVLGVGWPWEQHGGLGIALLAWLVGLEKDRAEGESRFALEEGLALRRWDGDWKHHAGGHGLEITDLLCKALSCGTSSGNAACSDAA